MAKHILIVGGGCVGTHSAMRLRKLIRSGEASVTPVDPPGSTNDRSILAGVVGGTVEPRSVAAPPAEVPAEVRVLTGYVAPTAHEARTAEFRPAQGPARAVLYDILVVSSARPFDEIVTPPDPIMERKSCDRFHQCTIPAKTSYDQS